MTATAHGDGCVEARRNRLSGALRQLYRPGTQSDDPGWLIVCEPHGTCLNVDTRRDGTSLMAEVDWCDECASLAGRRED